MALRWYTTLIESRAHRALADWWAEALGWEKMFDTEEETVLLPPWWRELEGRVPFHQLPPGLVFLPVEHDKQTKNRIHLDFAPHLDDDRDAEIERLLALGATRVDVGQGDDVPWDVLADPDGNEFCVLSARDS